MSIFRLSVMPSLRQRQTRALYRHNSIKQRTQLLVPANMLSAQEKQQQGRPWLILVLRLQACKGHITARQ